MTLVSQLLDSKGRTVHTVSPETSVLDAIRLMSEKHIGAIPVVSENNLVGIISERDYAWKVILKGRSSSGTNVSEIMTSEVVTTSPEDTIETCMGLMTEHHIRHLPVIADGQLVGILSIGDLVKSIIAEQEFRIEQLENYISA